MLSKKDINEIQIENLLLRTTIEENNAEKEALNDRIKHLEGELRNLKIQQQHEKSMSKHPKSLNFSSKNLLREILNHSLDKYDELENKMKILQESCAKKEFENKILLKRIDTLSKQFNNEIRRLHSELEKKSNELEILVQQNVQIDKEVQVEDDWVGNFENQSSDYSNKTIKENVVDIQFESSLRSTNSYCNQVNDFDKINEPPLLDLSAVIQNLNAVRDDDTEYVRMYKESFNFWSNLMKVDNWEKK